MTQKKSIISLFLILFLFISCKKKSATEIDEKFIGTWKHNIDNIHTIYLDINEDSKGFIERFENGEFKSDTQSRKWLIKGDKLYFGWLSSKDENFTIDKYPTIANTTIIHNLDTIQIGSRYIILDGNYYVD